MVHLAKWFKTRFSNSKTQSAAVSLKVKVAKNTGRVLLMGHFSTVGDLEVLGVVESWLTEIGRVYDTSPYSPEIRPALTNSVDWTLVDPDAFSEVVFVCGPMISEDRLPGFFVKFSHCSILGVNLSMVDSLNGFNPFAFLWARDRGTKGSPDLSFMFEEKKVLTIGICHAPVQKEYGDRQRQQEIEIVVDQFFRESGFCILKIDTRVPAHRNLTGLGTIDAISTLIEKCDVVVTSRLHGLVLSLKKGIPVIAIDPIQGGQKVFAQAKAIGWPCVCLADDFSTEWLVSAMAFCLREESKAEALIVSKRVIETLTLTKAEFQNALGRSLTDEPLENQITAKKNG